jgi:tetratricopeptide (TPR) repeat protein
LRSDDGYQWGGASFLASLFYSATAHNPAVEHGDLLDGQTMKVWERLARAFPKNLLCVDSGAMLVSAVWLCCRLGISAAEPGRTNVAPLVVNAVDESMDTNGVAPPEIDPVLRQSQEALATTNLLADPKAEPRRLEHLALLQEKLALARQQRQGKSFDAAERTLITVMQSDMPMECKRSALLEMALVAQDAQKPVRAQQIYSQYLHQFQGDPSAPEVLLRQGLLYRDMGASVLALSKFYAVMSTALNLKLDKLGYYQRLVLQAQTEIADTYYLQGKYAEASDFFTRLLKLDSPELNQAQILCKLIRSKYYAGSYTDAISQARLFVTRYSESGQLPEIQFLLADSLKRLGRKEEATKQVLALLEGQKDKAAKDPETWLYWQQRTGNEIANQLYEQGDFLDALQIYQHLGDVNSSIEWQLPVWYQVGLIYERLQQSEKAATMYDRILERRKEPGTNAPSSSLGTVLEMAQWRKERLAWLTRAERDQQQLLHVPDPSASVLPTKP